MALLRLNKVGWTLFFGVALLCYSDDSFAQEFREERLVEVAFGYAIVKEKLPEGYLYNPFFLIARLPLTRFSTKKKATFHLFAEPQFACTFPLQAF